MKGKLIDLCERGVVPDGMTRMGIRHLIGRRLDQEQKRNGRDDFFDYISKGPIAEDIDDANNQHYEVPDDFFRQVLGPRLKYSSALWPETKTDLSLDHLARAEIVGPHTGQWRVGGIVPQKQIR